MSDNQKTAGPSSEQLEELERLSTEKTEELSRYINELITLHSNSLMHALNEIASNTDQKLSFCLLLFTGEEARKSLKDPNSRGHRVLTSDVGEEELAAIFEQERQRLLQVAGYMKHVPRITHHSASISVH